MVTFFTLQRVGASIPFSIFILLIIRIRLYLLSFTNLAIIFSRYLLNGSFFSRGLKPTFQLGILLVKEKKCLINHPMRKAVAVTL